MLHDDKLIKRFNDLKDKANEIAEASEELTAILKTTFGTAKTLGAVLEKWPELSEYVPSIMSSCREVVIPTKVLNKRLDALKDNKLSTNKAMKIGSSK